MDKAPGKIAFSTKKIDSTDTDIIQLHDREKVLLQFPKVKSGRVTKGIEKMITKLYVFRFQIHNIPP